ncbi:hypothetical protein K8S19_07875 [bacterium]|nr:hypothetical protein [bacterium]
MSHPILLVLSTLFIASSLQAAQMVGSTPGNGGDTNPATFHFDNNNVDFQMTRTDGTVIAQADVPLLYGTEIVIYQNGQDYITARNLQVMGADLSGTQMTNASFPPAGYVAIDPTTGRFKFAGVCWYEIVRLDNSPAYTSWIGQVDINDQNVAVCEVGEYPSFGVSHSYSRHYTPTTGWSTAEVIWNTSDADSVVIGLDAQGKVLCTMMVDIAAVNRLYTTVYTPGSGWNSPGSLDGGSPDNNQTPGLAVNPTGDAVLGFLEEPGSYSYPYGNHYIANVGWETNVRLDNLVNTTSANNVKVDINAQGDGICVYWAPKFSGLGYNIYSNHFLKSRGGWQPQTSVMAISNYYFWYPDVAINDQGDAICATFASDGGGGSYMYASHYQAGVGWQPPQRVYTFVDPPGTSYYVPRLVMDNDGNAFIVFGDQINSTMRLLAMQYSPAQGWSGPVYLNSASGGEVTNSGLGIDMDNSGFAVCTFAQKETVASSYGRIMANWYHPQDGWQGAQLVDKTDANASVSPVKLNQQGRGIMGFAQNDGSYYRAYARFFENEIPGNNVQLKYAYIPTMPTPTPPPTSNTIVVTNRKIMPLRGEKTGIQLDMVRAGRVTIKVYTLQGQLVKTIVDTHTPAGSHIWQWGAENAQSVIVASGVYVIHLKTPDMESKEKVVVIK